MHASGLPEMVMTDERRNGAVSSNARNDPSQPQMAA